MSVAAAGVRDAETVRREASQWLDEHFDPDLSLAAWLDLLVDSGWAAPSWPPRWYGKGLSADLAASAYRVFAQAGVPGPPAGLGVMLAAPTVIAHGTEEQKRRFVRAVLTGEHAWCQLFSEPGAGSDLAGLAARAVRDGDDFVVDGQKVWTSMARTADFGMLLARTDPEVPKHSGITYFALDMNQAGVEIRPLRQMTGESHFAEVFFTAARVPAANVIGEVNGGWTVALTTLAVERTGLGTRAGTGFRLAAPGGSRLAASREVSVGEFMATARRGGQAGFGASGASMLAVGATPLIGLATELGRDRDPLVRQQIVRLHTLCQINAWNGRRGQAAVRAGGRPGPEASIGKLTASEVARLWRDTATMICGPQGLLAGSDGPLGNIVAMQALATPAPSIYGGSDQIQRNVIGERVLGLPKEPDPVKGRRFRELKTGTQS